MLDGAASPSVHCAVSLTGAISWTVSNENGPSNRHASHPAPETPSQGQLDRLVPVDLNTETDALRAAMATEPPDTERLARLLPAARAALGDLQSAGAERRVPIVDFYTGYRTTVRGASVGGRLAFPLSSLYHATKWAVEGFSESLQYELEPFNIRVKIIEPGPIKTDFYDRSMRVAETQGIRAYDEMTQRLLENSRKAAENAPDGSIVAQVIYDAVTDKSGRLRYGANTKGILAIRRAVPFPVFRRLIKKIILG